MSTKASYLYISETDEHWYKECSNGTIVLELNAKTIEKIEQDDIGIQIVLKAGSPLVLALESISGHGWPD
jgi:hypothetical protein